MDKTNSSSSNKDDYLKHLNKISYKISKQKTNNNNPSSSSSSFDSLNHHFHHLQPPPIQPSIPSSQSQSQSQAQNLQNQPPVYNINKSDFRDVVQKLTGSPAHERFNTPPAPIQQPKPPSSRLHRIRPPPLAHISNRPPSLLNSAAQVQTQAQVQVQPQPLIPNLHLNIQRQVSPLSPLPPLPTVHAAAESPVSAYMRYLHGSTSAVDSDPKRFSGFSPRWNSNSNQSPSSVGVLPYFPPSPLPFGCVPSPKSSYPLLSPTGGQFQFPLSPK